MPKENYYTIDLYKRVIASKLFIDKNFADNIDLNVIADESNFSKFHFTRLFKTIYGKAPHQYLTMVRIEKAKLLLQTEMPVAEVCFSVGFNSVSSFTGLFKQITTMPPSIYKMQQMKRKNEIRESPRKFIPSCFAKSSDQV